MPFITVQTNTLCQWFLSQDTRIGLKTKKQANVFTEWKNKAEETESSGTRSFQLKILQFLKLREVEDLGYVNNGLLIRHVVARGPALVRICFSSSGILGVLWFLACIISLIIRGKKNKIKITEFILRVSKGRCIDVDNVIFQLPC